MSVAQSIDQARGAAEGVTQEVAFEVLSSQRRRHVLHHLLQLPDGSAKLRDLTSQVAAWENETTPELVTSKQRMRVYTALRQSHLPKMDREGVVRFDPVSGLVELTEDAAQLEVYLDVVPHNEIPWSQYYLGLGAIGVALTSALWVNAFPFTLLPDLVWTGVLAVALTVSGLAHTLRNRAMKLGKEGRPPA